MPPHPGGGYFDFMWDIYAFDDPSARSPCNAPIIIPLIFCLNSLIVYNVIGVKLSEFHGASSERKSVNNRCLFLKAISNGRKYILRIIPCERNYESQILRPRN